MRFLNDLIYRLRLLFSRTHVEQELREELQFHFEQLTDRYTRSGMNTEEAQRQARLDLGGLSQLKQECLDIRRVEVFSSVCQDLAFAIRVVRKNAGLSSFIVLTLALGIGGCTAVWSALQALVLQGLPYQDPQSLVALWEHHPLVGKQEVSCPDFLDWRTEAHSFATMSAYTMAGADDVTLSGVAGSPQVVHATLASTNLLQTLGLSVALGRNFAPWDESGHKVAILSHELWLKRFHADAAVIGHSVRIDRAPVTIIGVMPAVARYPSWADLWMPLDAAALSQQRMYHVLEVVARLRSGVSHEAARQEFLTTVARLRKEHPYTNGSTGGQFLTLQEQELGETKAILLLLSGTAALVLLIVCAIVANLLFSKAAARQQEFQLRKALGASTLRLAQQILIETLLLGFCGTTFGCLLAGAALSGAKRQILMILPYGERWQVDGHFFVLALGSCLFTSFLCAGLQVFGSVRNDLLRAGHRSVGNSRRFVRISLITAQISFTFVVLLTTGLLARSLYNVVTRKIGLQMPGVLTFRLALPANTKDAAITNFYAQLYEKAQQLPGCGGIAFSGTRPFQPQAGRFFVDRQSEPQPGHYPVAQFRYVSPSFLPLLGVGLVRGRMFPQRDLSSSYSIINETMARRYPPCQYQ